MNKKTALLISAALILGAIYVFKFTDLFAEKNIHVLFRVRNGQPFFGFEREYHLTSIKVIDVQEASTNKYPRVLWHLVSQTSKGSDPISDFVHGQSIAGMKPAIAGTTPEPLKKGTEYRILIEAGKIKGQRDFKIQ